MSYPNVANEDRKCEEKKELPESTMCNVLREISGMAGDALVIARNINAFMTAESADVSEKTAEPRCFREELLHIRYDLFRLNNELANLANALGIG